MAAELVERSRLEVGSWRLEVRGWRLEVRGSRFGNSPKDWMMLIMAISVSGFNAWLAFIRGRVKVIQKRLYFPAQ